jgi:hypothetical protein
LSYASSPIPPGGDDDEFVNFPFVRFERHDNRDSFRFNSVPPMEIHQLGLIANPSAPERVHYVGFSEVAIVHLVACVFRKKNRTSFNTFPNPKFPGDEGEQPYTDQIYGLAESAVVLSTS